MRKRIFEIVQRAQPGDGISRAYDIVLVCTAVLSVMPLLFINENLTGLPKDIVTFIDVFTVYILILDYTMRWMTHDFRREQLGRKGDWRAFFLFPITPLAIIDLLAILPTITVLPQQLLFLRLLRLFKIFRFSKAFSSIGSVFRNESRIFISMGILFALYIFVAALIMYIAERDTFGNFITALYWSTTSLVTIGYGDLAPTTDLGRAINIISALFGVALIALPTAIITSGFMNEVRHEKVHRVASVGAIREAWRDIKMLHPFQRGRRLKKWLNKRKKVKVYLIVIVVLSLLDILLTVILDVVLHLPTYEYFGPMIAAVLLEPAAGIFVAFFSSMGVAIKMGSADQILQFVIPALASIAFGRLFSRYRKPGVLRSFVVFIFASFGASFVTLLLWTFLSNPGFSYEDIKYIGYFIASNEGILFQLTAFFYTAIGYFIACLYTSLICLVVRRLVKGRWLDPRTHFEYDSSEPILACDYANSSQDVRVRVNKLGADLMMRSIDEIAADLLVTPNLVEKYFEGKSMQMRESDQMLCPYEAGVEALIEEWLASRASEELQYIACDECGRWYHIDNLHARVYWDKYLDERITTFLCPHCRASEVEIDNPNLFLKEEGENVVVVDPKGSVVGEVQNIDSSKELSELIDEDVVSEVKDVETPVVEKETDAAKTTDDSINTKGN